MIRTTLVPLNYIALWGAISFLKLVCQIFIWSKLFHYLVTDIIVKRKGTIPIFTRNTT